MTDTLIALSNNANAIQRAVSENNLYSPERSVQIVHKTGTAIQEVRVSYNIDGQHCFQDSGSDQLPGAVVDGY